jgi:ribonuclease HI
MEPETTFHALWQCPAARDVWSAGGKIFQKSWFDGPDFLQVVDSMLKKCDQAEFAQFVSITRRIWLRRNEAIHDGSFLHPNRLIMQAVQAVEKYQMILAERKVKLAPNRDPSSSHWTTPPPGFFKANWDAGFDRKMGRVGLGVVIRDHWGKMWASKSQTKQGFLDPTTGEALAASMAAELCVEMGLSNVQLEGDAKNVVNAVLACEPDDSSRGHLIEDIKETLRAVPRWEIRHVRREENHVAHVLADLAVKDNMSMVWLYNPPDCICEMLKAEISALSDSI